jgi:hypothetical protein
VSHPSLGLPPADQRVVHPEAARRIREAGPRLAARALEVAIQGDPTMRVRYDEAGLRGRVHDAELIADRLANAVAVADPTVLGEYAKQVVPVYRRKGVTLDDLIRLCDGLRGALPAVLVPGELPLAGQALDEAVGVFRWHRRLAGDARKKNAFLQFIYKGG